MRFLSCVSCDSERKEINESMMRFACSSECSSLSTHHTIDQRLFVKKRPSSFEGHSSWAIIEPFHTSTETINPQRIYNRPTDRTDTSHRTPLWQNTDHTLEWSLCHISSLNFCSFVMTCQCSGLQTEWYQPRVTVHMQTSGLKSSDFVSLICVFSMNPLAHTSCI